MLPPKKSPDFIFLGAVFVLVCLGTLMMFSVSPIAGYKLYGDSYYYIKKHFIFLLCGFGLFNFGYYFDYRKYHKIAAPGVLLSIGLLLITYIPVFRITTGGASRWLNLGIFTFQPSELAKVFLIIFVAHAVCVKKEKIRSFFNGVLPITLVVGLVTGLILLQPDLGTTVVILLTMVVMLIVAGANIWELFILMLAGFRVISFFVLRTPYQMKRLTTFLNPWKDPLGAGFNTIQSLLAVGSGGFFGVGLGHSTQKFTYLPQQFTDFIFAILCEEGGFLLGTFTILTFAVLVIRGFRTAIFATDQFGRLLAVGISFCLGIQAIVNIMVVTGLSPAKGITLPFISYGGTSLVISLFMMGVLAQISCYKTEIN